MTWSARIEHTPAGLALTFGSPLSRLDMAPDVAQHLASLIAIEARAAARLVATDSPTIPGFAPHWRAEIDQTGDNAHPLCCDCDNCLNGGERGR